MRSNDFISALDVQAVAFALKHPFITAKGKKTKTRNVAVRLRLHSGVSGYGEASTSVAFANQTQPILLQTISDFGNRFIQKPFEHPNQLIPLIWKKSNHATAASAALECALWDAYAQSQHKPLARVLGSSLCSVQTDYTVSILSPKQVYQRVQAEYRNGFRHFKVKLKGQWVSEDLDRLKAARQAAPSARFVADGNQGFSLRSALQLASCIQEEKLPVFFFEQPFPRQALKTMQAYGKKAKLPLVADESIFTTRDAEKLFASGAAKGINIKIAKSGIQESLALIRLAKQKKKILSIGCMEESRWGLAPSVHLACGTGAFDWVDLDSSYLLKSQTRGGFISKGSHLSIDRHSTGLGIS